MRHPLRLRDTVITLLAVAFVASLTLRPAHIETLARPSPFLCLIGCGDESVRDLLSNILLFIPLGWAFRHWMSGRNAIAACLAATATIELLQATVIPGRDSSFRDILSNTLGGAAGVWLFSAWPSLVWPSFRRSVLLGGIASLVWTIILAGSGLGHTLTPTHASWFGFWTPELAYYQTYRGRLLSVDVGGWSPANGPIADPAPLREAMLRDSFRLTMNVITGTKPTGPSLIFAVIDTNQQAQVLIGQERSALWMRWRNRYEAWELRGTTVRIPIMPGVTPGSRVAIEAGRAEHHLFLRASRGGLTREVRVPETVGLGWNSMAPFLMAISSEWAVFNPIWLAGLILPLAYWFSRAGPVPGALCTASALLIGLLLVPLLSHAAATTLPEWIGGALGAFAGIALGIRSRGHLPRGSAQA